MSESRYDEEQELEDRIKRHAIEQLTSKLMTMSAAEIWKVTARLEMAGY